MTTALRLSRALLLSMAMVFVACAPVDGEGGDEDLLETSAEALTYPVLPNCNEATIRANAPPDARGMLDRAYDWIHRGVPYGQFVRPSSSPYRADCSGFVSMVWRLGGPGLTTYSFAGGPWATRASIRLGSRNQLRVGDALNYPGNPGAGTGHIVLFGGWLNSAHTRFCSLEESRTGTPARVIVRNVDSVYIPIRLATRRPGPLCQARCSNGAVIDGDCDRHSCGSGRCVSDSHGARCVDDGCPAWGTDTVCLDNHTVARCVNGDRRSTTRCTGANPRCSRQGDGMRCESSSCPASGRREVCLQNGEIATCSDGRMGDGRRCPAGTFCSEAGAGDANCVARVCVANNTQAPVAHDACIAGGDRLQCSGNGAATTVRCPAGHSCSNVDGHRCVAIACPAASGRVATCSGSNERVVCDRGVVIERSRCDGTCIADEGTPARCVATACTTRGSDGRVTLPPAHTICQNDGTLGHCDDEGRLATQPCAAGSRCVASGATASCVAPTPVPMPNPMPNPMPGPGDAGSPAPGDAGMGAPGDAGAPPVREDVPAIPVTGDAGTESDAEPEFPLPDEDSGVVDPNAPDPESDPSAEGVTEVDNMGCSVTHSTKGRSGPAAAALAMAAAALLRRRGRARRARP